MHDRTTLVTQGAPLDQQNLAGGVVGSTPYGFGYGIAGKFCDIMCYSQNFSLAGPGSLTASGFNLLRPIFSNPLMGLDASVGGDRAGISEDDTVNSAFGALALFVTAPKVAAYRTPPTARALPLEASPKVFPIQNGYWWSPKESGRGFFVEQRGTTVVFSGYLYATDGKATWFTTVGTVLNNLLNAPMQVYANGQSLTGAYKAPVLVESPGNVTLTFDEPDSATLQWPGGTVALERLDYEDGVDNTTETTAPFQALADSGYWLSTAEPGRGYVIEVQGDTLAIGGFMYDTIGNPVWYISNGKLSNFKQYKGTWQAFTGGQSLSGTYKPPVAAPLPSTSPRPPMAR